MHPERQRELVRRFFLMQDSGTTSLAETTYRIPGYHYCDAAVRDREQQALFRTRPLFVGMSGDAPRPGDYFTVEIGDFPVAVVRGEDGLLRGLVNACRHRGAPVFAGRGHVSRRAVTCPFHSWAYDLHGKLLGQPLANDGFADLDASSLSLRALPISERNGLILVTPYDAAEASTDSNSSAGLLDAAADEMAAFGLDRYVRVESRSRTLPLNWKLAMDTFMESYHIRTLHRDSIGPYYFSTPSVFDELGPVGRLIGIRSSIAELRENPESEWYILPHGTIQYFIPPSGIVVHQLDHVETWTIFSGTHPGESVCTTTVYAPAGSDERSIDRCQRNLHRLLAVTDNEDFGQGEKIQRMLSSGALDEIVFGRNEPALIHFHRTLERMLDPVELARPTR